MLHQVSMSGSGIKILFKRFKHSKGIPILVKIKKQASVLCPVKALSEYLSIRGLSRGPLFCLRDGASITYAKYQAMFKELVSQANLDADLCTHSARIGAATFAAASGISEENIKGMGHWASSAVKKYIKLPVLCF